MAKKRQRKAAKSEISCRVESVSKLGQQCGKVLARVLDLDRVMHAEISRPHAASSLYFHGVPLINAEIGGENRPVVPIKGAVDRWLHVAIDLRTTAGQWHVRHVSIGLLSGDMASKIPLLRAEWMMNDGEHDPGHAQPHWHVLGAASGRVEEETFDVLMATSTQGFDQFLGEDPELLEVNSVKPFADSFSHFHYAMVSDWHCVPSNGVSRNLDDEAALLSWLEGCVQYIRHQLGHVDRKAGR